MRRPCAPRAPRTARRAPPPRATPTRGCGGAALSSCENHIDKWYTEEFHQDNFEHTTKGEYGPSNFQTETVALVFWCHNKITECQIKVSSLSIGEKANATRLVEAPSA